MQKKKFIANLAILILLNLLIKPFWILGIEPLVQKEVGNEAYGEYFALFNFSFLLNILLDFGLTNFNNKNIAQNNHLLTKHFSSLFVLKLALGVLYLIVTIICGMVIGYDFRYMKLLLLLSFNQFLISMILYLRSNLLGLHLFKTDSVVSVLDRVIMVGICLGLILQWFGLGIDIMSFLYAQTGAYLLTAVIAFFTVLNKTHSFKFSWNFPFTIMILRKSFPYAILVLLMTFYNRLDAVMIERILPVGLGANEAGIYAKAFRLLDAANMIAYLFSIQLLPIFSRMLKFGESVEQMVKLSFTLLVTPAVVVSTGCFFYSEELCGLINHGNPDSVKVFSLLMCCFTAISTTYIFGTLLTANGNLRQLNIMAFSGICINLVLNIVLIPQLYAYGSAISSLVTQFLTAGVQIILATRIFKFKVNVRLLISFILFVLGGIGINMLSRLLPFNWIVNFTLMCGGCFVWAFATGLLSHKSILRFLKYS